MENAKFTIIGLTEAPDVKFEAAGYIVYETAGQFEKTLSDSIIAGTESITVDMEKVVVFTSIAVRVILKVYKNATEKGIELIIENPSDIVRNVLKLSNLSEMLFK